MDGIEKILAHILKESDAECAAIERESAEECERVRTEYDETAQNEYRKLMDSGIKEAERRLERLGSLAALESKKHVLATQQEMVAETFEFAAKKVLELPESTYIEFLAKQACAASLTGVESIILSVSDKKRFGTDVLNAANSALREAGRTASLTLSDETADIRGGLILSGGDIKVNCSIDALMAEYRNELAPAVASVLFD